MKRTLMRAVRVAIAAPLFVASAAAWAHAADAPDAWLTMKTKISLMTAEGLSASDLNVDTVMGVVTLHGKVPTESEKAKAEMTARGVDGVKDVKNLLQVVPDTAKKAVERSDAQIQESVAAAFKANKRVNASGIKLQSVNKGVVLLAGKTDSLEAHLEAVQVARAVPGVKRVATEVQITGGTN
jgi:hyperosmotically inducible periplasmic protein